MNKKSYFQYLLIVAGFVVILSSCAPAEGNHAGDEYMPDMYHSIAYESNYYDYYYYNTWGSEEDYYDIAKPREPVKGTIPRGYAGLSMAADPMAQSKVMKVMNGEDDVNSISVPVNGSVPYYYADNDAERLRAEQEIVQNPFPITEAGLAKGEELYDIFCGICHGEKGNGLGYLVSEENPNVKYLAAPANFLTDDGNNGLRSASNGRYYHAIMYGKNVMGAYADKMSYEERWQVIHYIRALQAKELKLTYNENENTLNDVEIPGASLPQMAMNEAEEVAEDQHDGDMHSEGEHDGHE